MRAILISLALFTIFLSVTFAQNQNQNSMKECLDRCFNEFCFRDDTSQERRQRCLNDLRLKLTCAAHKCQGQVWNCTDYMYCFNDMDTITYYQCRMICIHYQK